MKRHEDALGIQEGAVNVRAIARSLLEATDEAAGEGIGAEQDAAVRLIVHRLARLCRVDQVSYGYDPVTLADVYCTLMQECQTRAGERNAEPARLAGPVVMVQGGRVVELPTLSPG